MLAETTWPEVGIYAVTATMAMFMASLVWLSGAWLILCSAMKEVWQRKANDDRR